MKKNKKVLTGIAAAAVLVLAGVIGGGYLLTGDSRKDFPADGYILEVESGENGQSVAGITFSAGTKYRGKFPSSYIVKDVQGKKNVVVSASFIHYSDGSVSAFSDGMAVNMQEAGTGFLEFYKVKQGMVMTKAENGWEIDNNGNTLDFSELLWQISKDKVMAASDGMTLELSGREPEKISGYLEVTWPDKDVVQVANQDTVYQTVSAGGRILFAGGAVLDLQERAVLNASGEVSFTLEELMADMQNGGIAIRSNSDEEWQPPVFRVETEDGKDGEVGEDGDGGESGEDGEIGETGEDGEIGEEGEQGSQGAAGAAGAVGAGGGTAGSGGGNTANYSSGLGTVRISSLKYDCGRVDLTLVREDPESTLTQNGVVELWDAATNTLVPPSVPVDLSEGNPDPYIKVSFDSLSPDREYMILVKNGYRVEMETESGVIVNAGEKTFIKRNFSTDSEGVNLVTTKVEESGLKLALNRFADSGTGSDCGMLLIRCGDEWKTWPAKTSVPANLADWEKNGLNLDLAGLFGNAGKSDIPYRIELYTGAKNAEGWKSLYENGMVGETSGLHKSVQVLEGRTLKSRPGIGRVSAVLSNEGYYDLSVEVEDKDGSIKNYKFTVSDSNGNKKVIEATSNKVKWYFGEGLEGDIYTVDCEVTYYDNEKNNIVNAIPANITVTSTGSPTVVFEPYQTTITADGSYAWTDIDGQHITADSGSADFGTGFGGTGEKDSSVNAARIWGKLIVKPNGRTIVNNTLTIRVASNKTPGGKGKDDYNTTYSREITYNMTQGGVDAVQEIPVKCLGLKADTVYTLSVWGTVIDELTVGDNATSRNQREICLGSASVKTDKLAEVPDTETVAAFGISRDKSKGNVAQLYLAKIPENIDGGANEYAYINSTDPTSKYYFERSVARAVAIEIWTIDRAKLLGTIVKDLSKDTEGGKDGDYYGLNHSAGGYVWQDAGKITHAEARFYKGPLVTDAAYSFSLTEEDFKNAGINLANARQILVEPVALYDYSYGLIDDSRLYFGNDVADEDKYECFMAEPNEAARMNYNSMPLRPITLKYDDKVLDTLNSAVIDLDEEEPDLHDPAYEAIEVTEIKNTPSSNVITGATDPLLKDDTTVGLRVESKYRNNQRNGATSITYYGMTMDDYVAYTKNPEVDKDIVKAWREGDLTDRKIKLVEVTLEMNGDMKNQFARPENTGVPGVPMLYVMFTEDPALLAKGEEVTEEIKDNDGNVIKTATRTVYQAVKGPGNRAVLYTDQIERGHCYVFAMTLKTMYNVKTDIDPDAKPWEFPYQIGRSFNYTDRDEYSADKMQRSSGTNVFKETPRVAAYLDHTDPSVLGDSTKNKSSAYWEYLVYDPDGAMDPGTADKPKATAYGASGYAGRVFAGAKSELLSYVTANYKNGQTGGPFDYTKMTKDITSELNDWRSELYKVLSHSLYVPNGFSDKEKIKDRLRSFSLEISDGKDGKTLANPKGNSTVEEYDIWLASQEFDDRYGAYVYDNDGKTNAIAPEYEPAADEKHFAVPTAKHKFDTMNVSVGNIGNVEARVSLPDAKADNLSVGITPGSTEVGRRIVGFYYEFYKAKKNGSDYSLDKDQGNTNGDGSPKAIQWGFISYEETPQIVFDKPSAGDAIAVKLWAVYDTAVAGINRDAVTSNTHNLGDQLDAGGYAADLNKYYAIRNQKNVTQNLSAYYAGGITGGKLSFKNNEDAAGSLFEWRGKTTGQNSDTAYEFRTWEKEEVAALDYKYGTEGATAGGQDMPLLKGLAETGIKTMAAEGQNLIVNGTGDEKNQYIYLTVPATRPNIIKKKIEADGFHSADVTVQFSKKTLETLLVQNGPEYGDKVYLELCDENGKPLDNAGNRYFGFTEETEPDLYDNRAKKAAGTDLSGLPNAENIDRETDLLHGAPDIPATAYLQPEKDKADYKIAIRNLDRNKRYQLKMYCIKNDGQREDILDNDRQEIGSDKIGKDVLIEFATREKLNIGRVPGNTSTLSFTAVFLRSGYNKVYLRTTYSLDALKDYYAAYRIYRIEEDGSETLVFESDKMMPALNYVNKTTKKFHYYDVKQSRWTEREYDVYSDVAGKNYPLGSKDYDAPDRFEFAGDAKKQLTPGNYYLEFDAQDKYNDLGADGGENLPCSQNGTPTGDGGRERAGVRFTVPEQKDPGYGGTVTYRAVDGSLTANLGFRVTDADYRLGIQGDDGVEGGKYRLELAKKERNGNYTVVPMDSPGITIMTSSGQVTYTTDAKGMAELYTNSQYLISYPAETDVQYRIRVIGIDNGGEDQNERELYNSETSKDPDAARLRKKLLAGLMEAPNWEDYECGIADKKFTLSVYQGANLDQVRGVTYTLWNRTSLLSAPAVSVAASFSAPADGWSDLEIDLAEILDNWSQSNNLKSGDRLEIVVGFLDDDGNPLEVIQKEEEQAAMKQYSIRYKDNG